MQGYLNVEYIFFLIYTLLLGGIGLKPETFFTSALYTQLVVLWGLVTIIATLISLVLLSIFLYAAFSLRAIRAAEVKSFEAAVELPDSYEEPEEVGRWERIEAIFAGGDEAHWRQAILEADIMLDDMLTRSGYDGDTVGEKLKRIEPSDFSTLEYAWAAHKVRNNIAHGGTGYMLTEREAVQAMRWYKQVFEEFHFD